MSLPDPVPTPELGPEPDPAGTPPDQPPEENRQRQRRQAGRQARVACHRGSLGLGPNLALALLDVSLAGARLRVRAPLTPGCEVKLILSGPWLSAPIEALARVAWCEATPEGEHLAGVEFLRPLTYLDLANINGAGELG